MIKLLSFQGRDLYHDAWKFMYFSDKESYQEKIYDEVNPLQNKKLGTETDVWSVVAFDDSCLSWPSEKVMQYTIDNSVAIKKSGINIMERGIPVGIQSWVVTKNKIIGKQMIVSPKYEGKGICTAMMLESGRHLEGATKSTGDKFEEAYIGCSQFSKPILQYKFGLEPFSSSVENDMYKFNIPMEKLTDANFRKDSIENKGIGVY